MRSLRSEAGNIARGGAALLTLAAMMGLLAGCSLMGLGTPPNPLVGTWSIEIDAQGQTLLQTLTVADDLTGTITMEEAENPFPITELMVEGNAVSFSVVFSIQGFEIAASFTGTIEGDVLTGEYDSDQGTGAVTGKRM